MAEIVTKFYGKCEGLGEDKEVSTRSLITAFTQASGTIYQALTSAVSLLEGVSLISGQFLGIFLKAITSDIYYNPVGTAINTAACGYVSAGNFNFWTVQSGMTVIPALRAAISVAQAEIFLYGTS